MQIQRDFIKASCAIYHMGPVPDKGGTDLIVRPKIQPKTEKPRLYNVLMFNDDYTPMQFVVGLLQQHFNKDYAMAEALMLQIHTTGKTIAGTYPWDVAETKVCAAMDDAIGNGHPFLVAAEPA